MAEQIHHIHTDVPSDRGDSAAMMLVVLLVAILAIAAFAFFAFNGNLFRSAPNTGSDVNVEGSVDLPDTNVNPTPQTPAQ